MDINKIKNKLEKATISVSTINGDKPHAIAIMYAKIKDGKIILTNNFMKTTIEDIKENPNICLVFWEGEEGYRIEGEAEYFDSGKWFDFVKSLPENEDYSPKGAIVISVENIKELG